VPEDLGEVGPLSRGQLVGVLCTEVRLDGGDLGVADALGARDGGAAVNAGEDVRHGPSRRSRSANRATTSRSISGSALFGSVAATSRARKRPPTAE